MWGFECALWPPPGRTAPPPPLPGRADAPRADAPRAARFLVRCDAPTHDHAWAYLDNVLYRQGDGPFGESHTSPVTAAALGSAEAAFLCAHRARAAANPRYRSNRAAIYGEGAQNWAAARWTYSHVRGRARFRRRHDSRRDANSTKI